MELVRAAGGILWRGEAARRRVAVIHRVRKRDWSLPKGKLEPGETWRQAALREVAEETGFEATLGPFAGAKLSVDRPRPKLSLYWHMEVRGEAGPLADDVDEVDWLAPEDALERLDQDSDRRLLRHACGLGGALASGGGVLAAGRLMVVVGRCEGSTLERVMALVARAAGAPGARPAAGRSLALRG